MFTMRRLNAYRCSVAIAGYDALAKIRFFLYQNADIIYCFTIWLTCGEWAGWIVRCVDELNGFDFDSDCRSPMEVPEASHPKIEQKQSKANGKSKLTLFIHRFGIFRITQRGEFQLKPRKERLPQNQFDRLFWIFAIEMNRRQINRCAIVIADFDCIDWMVRCNRWIHSFVAATQADVKSRTFFLLALLSVSLHSPLNDAFHRRLQRTTVIDDEDDENEVTIEECLKKCR